MSRGPRGGYHFGAPSPPLEKEPHPLSSLLSHPSGTIEIEDLPDHRRRVSVRLANPSEYMPSGSCETGYSPSLIETLLRAKSPAWLIDEIRRDESPDYVEADLRAAILGFVPAASLAGRRLLDFGCGCGSSTMVLARMLPRTTIIGVELDDVSLEVARARARHYGVSTEFLKSPDGTRLPEGLGTFDAVLLSAVYEHLLPRERDTLVPLLWSALKPGGVLFVNQLPHRWFPIETHTTGLPLLNYLPDRWTLAAVRAFSRRRDRDESWEQLLRAGIRGGTQHDLVNRLARIGGGRPEPLRPSQNGCRDHADVWFAVASRRRWPAFKRALRIAYRAASAALGDPFAPTLSIAIRKS